MEKQYKTLTVKELIAVLCVHELQGFTSAEFIQYVSHTTPKLNKKDRETGLTQPWESVTKVCEARCSLKVIYQNAVNNALVKEGVQEKGENLFVAQSLPWGNWVEYVNGKKSKILIEHNGKYYIRTTYNNPNEKPVVMYLDQKGEVIPYEKIKGYLPPHKDETVAVRCYEVNGMKEVRLAGTIYTIVA